ncbi:MAG: PRC-barrel domain-containing protein [Thermomicrobiales bacterium]|jgi:uncharacterized protein YrrD|nr:PRC-barrel domain-containing protein [Thermomicrobiales bacterium]
MGSHQISIGADVRTSDGESIGKVTKLVVTPDDQKLTGFVADRGIMDSGRVVDLTEVATASEDLITLTISSADAEDLAGFAEHSFINVTGSQDSWIKLGPSTGDVPGTGGGSIFETPLPVNAEMRSIGALEGSEVALGHGTDVVDKIGKKIGEVDEVRIGEDGSIAGFVVRQGLVFHHDVYVPIGWVAGVTHEHVRLNVLKDEVEASKA